jgi:hypothetical protein
MKLRVILIVSAALSSCASMTNGPKQRVMVSTPGAPKAECSLYSKNTYMQSFVTPEALELPRSSEPIKIMCHKICFIDSERIFSPVITSENLISNSLLGGPGSLAIDLATKKSYNYTYEFMIKMEPDKRCKSAKKGFLDGDPKDFDNRIEDFSFDEKIAPALDTTANDKHMATTPDKP